MPDVVIVVEMEETALLVEVPRLGWSHDPSRGFVEEEVTGTGPTEKK